MDNSSAISLCCGMNQFVLVHCGSVLILDQLQLRKRPLSATCTNHQSQILLLLLLFLLLNAFSRGRRDITHVCFAYAFPQNVAVSKSLLINR